MGGLLPGPDRPVNRKDFFAELKRRRVYSVAVMHAVVAWLLIQVVTQVFPPFEFTHWAERLVIIAIVLGFPIALVFAWIYDITSHGIVRTREAQRERTEKRWNLRTPPIDQSRCCRSPI